VARTKIKRKQKITVFNAKKTSPGIQFKKAKGASQPPKKKITISADIIIILLYSAKKNIAKLIDEYSTLYPATNSASASGRSKGARLVSARAEIKKIIANGNNGHINQTSR